MTKEIFTAGPDFDALVASHVMGWVRDQDGIWHTPRVKGVAGHGVEVPHYSTDIHDAWPILEKFIDFSIDSENWVMGTYTVKVWLLADNDQTRTGESEVHRFEDIPLAICRAAIYAIG